jgi:hypothetical protein
MERAGNILFLALPVALFAVSFLLPQVGRASGHGREAGKQAKPGSDLFGCGEPGTESRRGLWEGEGRKIK